MTLKIQSGIILNKLTNFQIGGRARYFCQLNKNEEIIEALEFADKKSLPYFILGGGTNILVSDSGFDGLVIKMSNQKSEIEGIRIIAEAGVLVSDLINQALKYGLTGLEWAGGLPGTIGGAVRGNAGCFGAEIKDKVIKVTSINKNGKIIERDNAACQFNYRDSIFKHNDEIILSVELELEEGNSADIMRVRDEKINYRKTRHPIDFPNIGSIFKNCSIKLAPNDLQEKFKDKIKHDPFPVIPTAALIDEAGLKNKKIGGAKVSEKHPNFIINFNQAKAEDVLILMSLIKDRIKNQFNVLLDEEVQLVGF